MTKELVQNERETKLALALQALSERELQAYRYFLHANQAPIADDKSAELFVLYRRGTSCEEIRRLFKVFSLGQVVACRVQGEWDVKKRDEDAVVQREVPMRTANTELETQEFVADMLGVSRRMFNDAMKLYIATGDPEELKKIPFVKSVKELKDLVELYRSLAGTDTKKVNVSVSGGVAHIVAQAKMKPEDAEAIVDRLLKNRPEKEDAVDVESTPVSEVVAIAPVQAAPKTPAAMVEKLVSTGVPRDKAQAIVENIGKETEALAQKFVEITKDAAKKPDGEVN